MIQGTRSPHLELYTSYNFQNQIKKCSNNYSNYYSKSPLNTISHLFLPHHHSCLKHHHINFQTFYSSLFFLSFCLLLLFPKAAYSTALFVSSIAFSTGVLFLPSPVINFLSHPLSSPLSLVLSLSYHITSYLFLRTRTTTNKKIKEL